MFQGHPRGLVYIFLTEMWERVGFYTLMAILVLYMDRVLGWPDSRKGDWYGLFLAGCYFVPLLGGWIGDNLLGQINTVTAGALVMALGYGALGLSSASQVTSFYVGLLLIALGTGIFKVNISVLVGNLYADKVHLKDAGFNIFYMGVNVGAAIAPLLATFVSVSLRSYNISFWICAAGLLLAVVIFRSGRSHLVHADNRLAHRAAAGKPGAADAPGAGSTHAPGTGRADPPGTGPAAAPGAASPETLQRLLTLVSLYVIVIFFWVAFYQNGFALTLFAERSTRVFRFLRPETYQFFEPAFILGMTPLLLAYFGRLNRQGREPSTPVKIFSGMLIMSLAMLVMVAASLAGGNRDQNIMSPAWLIGTYFVVTLAEILISPMGQSFVSKVAPPKLQGLMMGGWFAAIAAGSYGSGALGKHYSSFAHHQYFLLLTGLLAVSAVLTLVFMKRLRRFAA